MSCKQCCHSPEVELLNLIYFYLKHFEEPQAVYKGQCEREHGLVGAHWGAI